MAMFEPVEEWFDWLRDGLQDEEYVLVGLVILITPFVLPFMVLAWFVGAGAAWVLVDDEEEGG